MRKTPAFLILLLWTSAVRAETVSLPRAADLMIQNNPAYAQKRLQTEAAGQQSRQATSAYWPRLDFVQDWTRSNNPVFSFGSLLNQQRFTEADFALDALNHPAPLTDVSSRFQLGWLLYDFGGRESQASVSRSMHRIAQLTQDSARLGLLQELVRRYYGVSLADQRLAAAEDSLQSAESRLHQATDRVTQGLAVATESLSAEVFAARARQEKIDAENQTRLARAGLNELLGNSLEGDFSTDALAERTFHDHDLPWWTQQMQANRPELKIADEGAHVSGQRAKAANSAFLPAIQAFSSYEWHGSSLDYTGENWTAGLELRWNLFRGLSDASGRSIADLQKREAEQRRRETGNALALQLQSAFYKYGAAQEKVRVASAALSQAAENRRIYAERYAAGLVSIQDSLQAESSYSETRLMYMSNLYDLYVAHAELLAAAGLPSEIVAGDAQ